MFIAVNPIDNLLVTDTARHPLETIHSTNTYHKFRCIQRASWEKCSRLNSVNIYHHFGGGILFNKQIYKLKFKVRVSRYIFFKGRPHYESFVIRTVVGGLVMHSDNVFLLNKIYELHKS